VSSVVANNTAAVLAQSVETVQTVDAKSVMKKDDRSFWVLYGAHTEPTFLEDAGDGQAKQRYNALSWVKKWRVCLDIGSNIGQWTRPLAKRFESVICFEPNPNFRECFEKNITDDNVILHPFGLSDKEHTASQDFNSTQLKDMPGKVKLKTLDSFGLSHVDLIKIDVDGYEIPLLNGARETLTKNNPVINIEMKKQKRSDIVKKCEKILSEYGYHYESRVRSDEVWIKNS